jgi:hypothetical protein
MSKDFGDTIFFDRGECGLLTPLLLYEPETFLSDALYESLSSTLDYRDHDPDRDRDPDPDPDHDRDRNPDSDPDHDPDSDSDPDHDHDRNPDSDPDHDLLNLCRRLPLIILARKRLRQKIAGRKDCAEVFGRLSMS